MTGPKKDFSIKMLSSRNPQFQFNLFKFDFYFFDRQQYLKFILSKKG
jgi:hypothetical protein